MGCGVFPSVETAAKKLVKVISTVEPEAELAEKYERKYREFQKYYPALKAL